LPLRLLNGPDDWTVDAAAFALGVSAWVFPKQRVDAAEAITDRYLVAARAVGKRPTALHYPLAEVLLACPAMEVRASRPARDFLTGPAFQAPEPRSPDGPIRTH
jgi:hypothetical protein